MKSYYQLNSLFSTDIFYIVIIFFALLCLILFKPKKKKKKNKLVELKKTTQNKAHGIIFGRIHNKVLFSPIQSEGHCLIASATGTGKTTSIGIPTLNSLGDTATAFVIDISGDIYKNCYNKQNILLFEPENRNTIPYNIFSHIDRMGDVEDQNEALAQLAFLLMPQPPKMDDNARYFTVNGRKILTSALIAFYHQGFDFAEIMEKILASSWQTLFAEIDETKNENAILFINAFEGSNEKNTSGCKQACDEAITLFVTNRNVRNALRRPQKDEIAIDAKKIEEKSIYLLVSDEKLDLYAPLLNIVTSLQAQYISTRIVTPKSKTILLLLDEFTSLKLDAYMCLNMLKKYRKKLCRVLILTQNLADFKYLYGHDITQALLANFRFIVLLGGLGETESQKYFANLIGFKIKTKKSISKSAKSTTRTEAEEKELIFEPAELDRQGKDTAILIAPNEHKGYFLLKKNYYYKYCKRKSKRI